MNKLLDGYLWELGDYCLYTPPGEHGHITRHDASHAFQLIPPVRDADKVKDPSDYIIRAKATHELKHVFFFMSENERYFNSFIESFCIKDGAELSPQRYLDMKLACRETVLLHFQDYDPTHGATFLTFLRRFIADALLRFRMTEEDWSIGSLTAYKRARKIAAMYRHFKGNEPKTLLTFCHNTGYSVKVARKLLDAARIMRNRFQPRLLDEEDDEWELADDLLVDDWDYVSMLYDGMEAEQVDRAFRKLNYRDQTLL